MLIAEEGLFKKFIERRHEKKELRKRNREKLIKMSELILKYSKKYIVPHGMKIVKEITDYTKNECKKKGIDVLIDYENRIFKNDDTLYYFITFKK